MLSPFERMPSIFWHEALLLWGSADPWDAQHFALQKSIGFCLANDAFLPRRDAVLSEKDAIMLFAFEL